MLHPSMRYGPLPSKPYPKSTRLGKRKRVTLVAAFRCEGGVVLCADSQETIDIPERGSYRVNVDKLERKDAGQYEVIIGGAGDGALVDGFVDQFAERVSEWQGEYQESEMLGRIRQFVRDYYAIEVDLSPAHPDDKNLGFVICLRRKSDGALSLLRTVDLHVRSVSDLTLLGWEEPLYWREAKRLYHLNLTEASTPSSSEAMLLGVHLFSIAKETSNVISGDTKILVARSDGIYALNPNDVRELEARVKAFEGLLSFIFLALPDVTVTHTELARYLKNFEDLALQFHDHFTLQIAQTAMERFKALPGYPHVEDIPEDPYLQFPTPEQLKKSFEEDEVFIRISEMSEAYRRQSEAETGWENFADVKGSQIGKELNKTAHALERLAKLNRAVYESGQYGQVGSKDAIAVRQEIARRVYIANEALIELLEGQKKEFPPAPPLSE